MSEDVSSNELLCDKCGSMNVKTSYIKDGKLINPSSCEKIDNDFIQSSEYDYFYQLKAKKEHLSVICSNCGYETRKDTYT